jgi:hemerythrin superfamily protein
MSNPNISQEPAHPAELSTSQQKSSKLVANLSMAGAPVFVESDSIIDLIVDDHRNARELYENYKHTDARNAKKTIVKELIKTLVVHDECEQLLVYPLLKEKIGGSEEATRLYEKSLGEHQEHRELLYEVYNLDINKEFEKLDNKLKQAMASVVHHVEEEERDVLPLIQKHLTEEELKKVGASFRAHKPFSATRPHPSAPQTGFPAALGNMILKPFDALRDFVEG